MVYAGAIIPQHHPLPKTCTEQMHEILFELLEADGALHASLNDAKRERNSNQWPSHSIRPVSSVGAEAGGRPGSITARKAVRKACSLAWVGVQSLTACRAPRCHVERALSQACTAEIQAQKAGSSVVVEWVSANAV